MFPLIIGMKSSGRRGIIKKHVKRGSGGAKICVEGVLSGSGSISRFEQRKVHRKLDDRHAGQLIWSGRRIIWIDIMYYSILPHLHDM